MQQKPRDEEKKIDINVWIFLTFPDGKIYDTEKNFKIFLEKNENPGKFPKNIRSDLKKLSEFFYRYSVSTRKFNSD